MASPDKPATKKAQQTEEVDKARRKLLRVLVYAAPAVVSTVVVKPAHAQVVSCGPVTCPPLGGSCMPQGGGCPPTGAPCGPSNCRPRA